MKFAATAAALASLAAVAHGADCPASLVEALAIPELVECQTASGFGLSATTISTDTLAKFCKNDACLKLLSTARELELPECTIAGKQLYADILDPAEAACELESGSSSTTEDSHDHASHGAAAMSGSQAHGSGSVEGSSDNDSAAMTPSSNSTSNNKTSSSNSTSSNSISSNKTSTTPAPTTASSAAAGSSLSMATMAAASAVVLSVAVAFF